MNSNLELAAALVKQSQSGTAHREYEAELSFYSAVQSGDIEKVKKLYTPLNADNMGVLSTNKIHNLRYHFIITTAFITRFCIEKGMPTEPAYTLSDLYIRKADTLSSLESISELHKQMILDFTNRMKALDKKKVNSKTVRLAMEYIRSKIREPIKLQEIADHLCINATYLSSLFKQENGIPMNSYIQKLRVEEAANMLKFSDMSLIDISEELCFSTQSHFISVFKKHTGMTPREYRNKFYNKNWTKESLEEKFKQ